MSIFKKKTPEEKAFKKEIKEDKKEVKKILKDTEGGYNRKTLAELSNGRGDDE